MSSYKKGNGRQHVSIFPQFLEVTFPPKYRNEKIYQCFFLQYVHCTVPKKFIAETVQGHKTQEKPSLYVRRATYYFEMILLNLYLLVKVQIQPEAEFMNVQFP